MKPLLFLAFFRLGNLQSGGIQFHRQIPCQYITDIVQIQVLVLHAGLQRVRPPFQADEFLPVGTVAVSGNVVFQGREDQQGDCESDEYDEDRAERDVNAEPCEFEGHNLLVRVVVHHDQAVSVLQSLECGILVHVLLLPGGPVSFKCRIFRAFVQSFLLTRGETSVVGSLRLLKNTSIPTMLEITRRNWFILKKNHWPLTGLARCSWQAAGRPVSMQPSFSLC